MKSIHTMLLLYMCVTACGEPETLPVTDNIRVLSDKTDLLNDDSISGTDLRNLLKVSGPEPLAGATVSITVLTDLIHNRSFTAYIPPELPSESNALVRKNRVATFYKDLDSVISVSGTIPSGREYSEVFRPLAQALNELAQCDDDRMLILISDCLENNSRFSVYHGGLETLEQEPDRLQFLIPISYPLDGIVVHLVHQPTTQTDDLMFDRMATMLRTYLENEGAKVIISTSINPRLCSVQ